MCRWYCTSEGPSTNLQCLHCKVHYCGACLHGEGGKMESLVKCARCGKKPRVLDASQRGEWKMEAVPRPQTVHSLAFDEPTSPTHRGKAPAGGNIFDRLTDTSKYTGSHKHRFDANGNGLGQAGRDFTPKGAGHVPQSHAISGGGPADLSSMLRNDRPAVASPTHRASPIVSPTASRSPAASARGSGPMSPGAKKSNIFDRLTDSSQYTGAHKHRFDASGHGRGMAGRDAASGIQYSGGAVTHLSQITRSNLN